MTDGSTQLICDQSSCPLLQNGNCLDAFDPPSDCPHSSWIEQPGVSAPETANIDSAPQPPATPGDIAAQIAAAVSTDKAEDFSTTTKPDRQVEGGTSLTMREAERTVQDVVTTVVLIAGEAEAGKTTLVTELWAAFLTGPFAGWSFAGSRTLNALSKRHFKARVSSGLSEPTTDRTADEDMRLLHLRVVRDEEATNLLMSDVRGEFFEFVINGATVGAQVPLAGRADKCIVVLDGERMRDAGERALHIFNTTSLIGGLLAEGGLRHGVPVLIVCTKGDSLTNEERVEVKAELATLASNAFNSPDWPVDTKVISSRSMETGTGPFGLDSVLEWLTDRRRRKVESSADQDAADDRYFWRKIGGDT
jgi:hypothetical protein